MEGLSPDCILVEGPPDANELIALAAHAEMKPPVALLVYDPEKPERAAYYPFAAFSPEWQAIHFGVARGVAIRFMDLPQSIHVALMAEAESKAQAATPVEPEESEDVTQNVEPEAVKARSLENLRLDPLSHLARAAGYSDSERWWEQMVEHRQDGTEIFAAVLEAMTALRDAAVPSSLEQLEPETEARREAHMRQMIRAAQKEGFERIAVVCGAWHAPALARMPPAKEDAAVLKGLPKRKVAATWIPWTYSRLASASGYGAGVESPGWYHFLWELNDRAGVAANWLARVAPLLRGGDLGVSSARIL